MPDPRRLAPGKVITIASASGGCGKTFLATNAAELLARATNQPVVLVDLDLQFGEVSVALRLRPDFTIADALRAEAEGHNLDESIDEFLIRHPDGFSVLAAPRRPAEADSIVPGDVVRILDALRARGAWVVIDTAEGLGEMLVTALDTTDHLFALATPDRPSLVNLGTFLTAVDRLGMGKERISVVLNKAEPDLGLDLHDMALQLGCRFAAVVPYSSEVSLSVNLGVPLVASGSKSPVTTELRRALELAIAEPPAVTSDPTVRIALPAKALPARRRTVPPATDASALAPETTVAPSESAVTTPAEAAVTPALPPAPDSIDPAVVLRPRRSRHAPGNPDRRRPRSSRPARSGPSRPSKPSLAAMDCSERGPPGPPPSGRARHRSGVPFPPTVASGRDCDEPLRH